MADIDTGSNPFLRRSYELAGAEDAAVLYDEWAETYDADIVESMGYVGPAVAAARLAELAPSGVVLDAGAGTGLVGVELAARGSYTVDGVDASPVMLEKAMATGCYRRVEVADLTVRLPIDDAAYDAVTCVGTLTEGHVGPEALAEFVRVTRSGGHVVATILDPIWEPKGYQAAVDALVEDGQVALREADEHPYRTLQDVTCRLVVLDVR
ncbi:methyltransferase family protein [Actinomycetospora succinea]|uniref:Methyltransferase family protein n=1 Tax=Actinomycetospora succinea TaxID=663603 RepID=A0A4R6VK17_9PSEU|nr:class I SAM-dependent methyltransferase [Actinomycetospora succinea]TDQ58889.1 methyltransferase family protein [Actinomycetospora succinea]